MKIQIRNRFTNEVKIEAEAKALREVVENNCADLRDANLRDANLIGADLRDAKIKITQKETIINSLGLVIEE